MRLHVEYPRQIHAHYRADRRSFALLDDADTELALVHLDDVRDAAAARDPMQLTPAGRTPFTLPVGALERLLSCVETRTDAGDTLEIDYAASAPQLLLNGKHVATLPDSVRSVTFMPIRTQYLRDIPGRFVAILGRGGAFLFDLHTHDLIDATMPAAATAQRAAGGAA